MGGFSNPNGPYAVPLDSTFAADRKYGQLVRIKPNGNATTALGEGNVLFLPLAEAVTVVGVQADMKPHAAGVRHSGMAEVYVETAANIDVGDEVGIGATGIGCAVHATGFKLGIAMTKPKGDGDTISVLLAPAPQGSIY